MSWTLQMAFQERLDQKPPSPPLLNPALQNLKSVKESGKIIVKWDIPDSHQDLTYFGRWYETNCGELDDSPRIEVRGANQYQLKNIHPCKQYDIEVWYVTADGTKSEAAVLSKVMLCKDLGGTFVDDSTKLRSGDGYRVYKGYIKSASSDLDGVAVKIVPAGNLREVEALQELSHHNIVHYRASGEVDDKITLGKAIFIAMELCDTETFLELVSKGKLNEVECKLALLHIMHGLAAIHEKNIRHRDLKPQNILRSRDGKNIKIIDFDISKRGKENASELTKSSLEIGTEGWGSPEHYEGRLKMSTKSDIYSAGLVFAFALSGGQHIFGKEAHSWKTSIITGKPKADLSILTCEDANIAEDLISCMLQREPNHRPTAEDVLTHPFFWDGTKKLQFLHQMSSFFQQFTQKASRDKYTDAVIGNMQHQWHVIRTSGKKNNWLQKMKETEGVEANYSFVLKKANGEVKPGGRYDHKSVIDLVRFIRNIKEHYQEHKELKHEFRNSKESIWKFFSRCFPELLCKVRNAVLKEWPDIAEDSSQFPKEAGKFFIETAPYEPLGATKVPDHSHAQLENSFPKLSVGDGDTDTEEVSGSKSNQ